MTQQATVDAALTIPGAPPIPGLRFRLFRGESDYPAMVAVANACLAADRRDHVFTLDILRSVYATLKNCDPARDVVMVEIDGRLVGFKLVRWAEEAGGTRIYSHSGYLHPGWRGRGLGEALVRHSEAALRAIAAAHRDTGPRFFQTFAGDGQEAFEALLHARGYAPVRHMYEMVCPNLAAVPAADLPPAFAVRPVEPAHYRAIWAAEDEAFRDHWGAGPPEEADEEGAYGRWLAQPLFQPQLWQVAWDGNEVAGMVRNFVVAEENAAHGRRRGYTENISVRRPWRRQGLARALLARSMAMHRAMGMTEAALGVDTENPNGALRLYERMGFRVARRQACYRKPL